MSRNDRTLARKALVLALLNAGLPVASAVIAFRQSARAHVLEDIAAMSVCGNGAHLTGARFLGHCYACWNAGAMAAAVTFAAMLTLRMMMKALRQDGSVVL